MVPRLVVALVVLIALAGGLYSSSYWQPPPTVSGAVEADEIRIGSRVGGRVAKVHVEEGQRVSAGEVLVELEPYDLLERISEAEAQLAAAQADFESFNTGFRKEEIAQAKARRDKLAATLEKLIAGPRPQEIAAAEALVTAAEAQLDLTRYSLRRIQQLSGTGAATQEELDEASERFKSAQAQVEVRQQELSLLREGTRKEEIAEAQAQLEEAEQTYQLHKEGYRKEQIASAKSKVDAAQGKLAALRKQVDELEIRASAAGIVEAIELQPGDLVGANAPVLSLLDTSRMWIRAYFPETELDVAIDQQLPVTIDSYPDQTFSAEVTFLSRQAEFTPRNVQTPEERAKQVYRVKLRLVDAPPNLRPGMLADVWLESNSD